MSSATLERPKLIQYHITPDKKPIEKLVGSVDSKTGEFKGKMTNKRMVYPPKQLIPYSYTAYVKKIIEKDKDGKDKEYEGQIKFLDPKVAGGEHMEIRFLSSCPSLDRKYQEKHGFKPASEEDGLGQLFQGAMIYDVPEVPTNALYREMMNHHPNNGDNPNRPKDAPVYFKIRNGKSDVEGRKAKMEYNRKIADLQFAIAEDDNSVEVFSIIYKINPSYELNARREMLLEKFDKAGGAESVMQIAEQYFTNLKSRFQFLLDKGVAEVSDEKLIFKSDKKPTGLKVKFGADADKFADVLVEECHTNHKILSQWIEIESKLNN